MSEDEAKTFGNIDYMRKEVVIRRTFAKKKGQAEELESVKSISASSAKPVGEASRPGATSFGTSSFSAPLSAKSTPAAPKSEEPKSTTAPAPRRAPDTSMDMFRNMAKNIRR